MISLDSKIKQILSMEKRKKETSKEKKVPMIEKRKCILKGCRTMYQIRTSWQKYCTRRCKQIAWHLKQAKALRKQRSVRNAAEKPETCN